jgi:hypothetical protein
MDVPPTLGKCGFVTKPQSVAVMSAPHIFKFRARFRRGFARNASVSAHVCEICVIRLAN